MAATCGWRRSGPPRSGGPLRPVPPSRSTPFAAPELVLRQPPPTRVPRQPPVLNRRRRDQEFLFVCVFTTHWIPVAGLGVAARSVRRQPARGLRLLGVPRRLLLI